jgi:RNA polymerase sigma-70 factor (ECF subfamily)
LNTADKVQKSTIEALFDLLHGDDLDSFGKVFAPIRGRIVRLAQYRLQREDVEDVVQQTLSTFWEKRSAVRDPEHILPFIFKILRNKLGDSYRRKGRQQEIHIEDAKAVNALQDTAAANPGLLLEEKEFERILKEAISICAAENGSWGRILQLLREEQPRKQIRKELGNIPMATVYTRVYRARQRLLRILKDEFGVEI